MTHPSPVPETKWQPWSPDSGDRRQHTAATRVPGTQDGPVSCKIKLLFLEAICVLRKRINKLTPWPLKKCTRTKNLFHYFRPMGENELCNWNGNGTSWAWRVRAGCSLRCCPQWVGNQTPPKRTERAFWVQCEVPGHRSGLYSSVLQGARATRELFHN